MSQQFIDASPITVTNPLLEQDDQEQSSQKSFIDASPVFGGQSISSLRCAYNLYSGTMSQAAETDRLARQSGQTPDMVDALKNETQNEVNAKYVEDAHTKEVAERFTALDPKNAAYLTEDKALAELSEYLRDEAFKEDEELTALSASMYAKSDIGRNSIDVSEATGDDFWTNTERDIALGKLDIRKSYLGSKIAVLSLFSEADREELLREAKEIKEREEQLKIKSTDPLGFHGFMRQVPRQLMIDIPAGLAGATAVGLASAKAGALAGGGVGTVIEPIGGQVPGATIGGTIGGLGGAYVGYEAGTFISSLYTEAGSMMYDMLTETDDAGNYVEDIDSARLASVIYGFVAAGIETGSEALAGKMFGVGELLKRFSGMPKQQVKSAIRQAMKDKSLGDALLGLAKNIIGGTAIETGEESAQSAVQIEITKLLKDYLESSGDNFWYGVNEHALEGENLKEVLNSGKEAAKISPWFFLIQGGLQLAGYVTSAKRAEAFAEKQTKIAEILDSSVMHEAAPGRVEEFLQISGMDSSVLVPANAVLEMQQMGMDVVGAMGWEQQTVEKMAAAGHDIRVKASSLQAHLDLETMRMMIDIMREDTEVSMSKRDAANVNEFLQADIADIDRKAEDFLDKRDAENYELNRLRNEIRTTIQSVPNLMKQIEASPDKETTLNRVVEDNLRMMVAAAYANEKRGGGSVAEFLGKLVIQGLDEQGLTPDESMAQHEADIQEDANQDFWMRTWGLVDAESLIANGHATRSEVRALRRSMPGLFAPRGKGRSLEAIAATYEEDGTNADLAHADGIWTAINGTVTPSKRALNRWGWKSIRDQERMAERAAGRANAAQNAYTDGLINITVDDLIAASNRDDVESDDPFSWGQNAIPTASVEAVRAQYEGTAEWMTAPNGKPTNLNETQWLQVRTPEFKAWFGDWENDPQNASKVVDENGEPMVVYHGTNKGDFDTFITSNMWGYGAAYFSKYKDTAEAFSRQWGNNKESRIYDVYINLRNPYIVDAETRPYDGISRPSDMKGAGNTVDTQEIAMWAREHGYDGVVVRNVREADTITDDIMPFGPAQIKSATANRGTFDAGDPNIYMQVIGEQGARAMDMAEEATTRMDNLGVARDMESAGKDARAIKMATGWERGADGKWRYEIGDFYDWANADVTMKIKDGVRYAETTLGEIIDDAHGLFDAYPELKDTKVFFKDLDGDTNGFYDPRDKSITLEAGLLTRETEAYKAWEKRKAEFEANNSDYRAWVEKHWSIEEDETLSAEEKEKQQKSAKQAFFRTESGPLYDDILSEGYRSLDEGDATYTLNPDTKSILIHEIQHAIQEKEGFARGGAKELFAGEEQKLKEELEPLREHLAHLEEWSGIRDFVAKSMLEVVEKKKTLDDHWRDLEEFKKTDPEYLDNAESIDRVNKEIKDAIDYFKATHGNATTEYGMYLAIAGEVEARNASARMYMDADERRASLLSDTEDVAREDQIFLDRYGRFAAESALLPYQEKLSTDKEKYYASLEKAFERLNKKQKVEGPIQILSQTPLVLDLISEGETDVPVPNRGGVYLSQHALNQTITPEEKDGHPDMFDIEIFKQIPDALAEPLAIFDVTEDSAEFDEHFEDGDVIFIVQVKDKNNAPVILPLSFRGKGRHGVEINVLKTAFGKTYFGGPKKGKPNFAWIEKQLVEKNAARYIDERPLKRWLGAAGSTFPSGHTNAYGHKIHRRKELNNLRSKFNNEYYQVAADDSLDQRGWHSGRADFDRFDFGFMGTGEGNQAHGWGGYYAADMLKSDAYREAFTRGQRKISVPNRGVAKYDGMRWTIGDKPVTDAEDYVLTQLSENKSRKTIKDSLEKMLSEEQSESSKEIMRDALSFVDEVNTEGFGQLYEVEIPEDDVMLNENHALLGQSRNVIESIAESGLYEPFSRLIADAESLGDGVRDLVIKHMANDFIDDADYEASKAELEKLPKEFQDRFWEVSDATGKDIYSHISSKLGSDKAASLALLDAGIEGITYVGEVDGKCWVIFDEKKIEIIQKYYQEQMAGKNGRGGSRGFIRPEKDNSRYVIQLMANADLSTLSHEFGHMRLLEMERMINEGIADEQTVKDWQTLQDWLSCLDDDAKFKEQYDLYVSHNAAFYGKKFEDLDAEERARAKRLAGQEMMARGLEAYLREGKAPSSKMEGVFRRFAKWLKRVYRDAVMLHVELNDDVRRVFDRLVALDDEMDNVARENGLREESERLLDEVGLEGSKRLEAQTLMRDAIENAADDMRRVRDAGDRERMKRWARIAKEQVAKETVYMARHAMSKEPIDLDAFEAVYGHDMAVALAKKLPNAVRRGGDGQNIELVAADHGYANAGEMVTAILEAPKEGVRVKEVIEELQNEYDESYDPWEYLAERDEVAKKEELIAEALAKKMQAAVAGARYANELAGETLNGTAVDQSGQMTPKNRWMVGRLQLRQQAAAFLQSLDLSDAMDAAKYRRAASKWLNEERRAILTGNWQKALEANYKARLNIELARQSKEIRDGKTKLEKEVKAFLNKDLKDALKNMDDAGKKVVMGARFAVYALARNCGLIKMTQKMHDNAAGHSWDDVKDFLREAGKAAILTVYDDGHGNVTCEEVDTGLFGKSLNLSTASVTEYQDLNEALSVIMHVANGFRIVETKQGKKDFAERMTAVAESIYAKNAHREPGAFEKRSKIGTLLKQMHAAHLKADTIALLLDGDAMGEAWHSIVEPINRATWERAERLKKEAANLKKLFSVYSRKELVNMKAVRTFIPAIGASITKEQAIAVLLNCGNESNLQRLKAGFKIKGQPLTDEQIGAIIDTLDRRDVDFAQSVWSYFESFKKESFDLQESITGVRPREVQGRPFQTKFGMLEGGYYPVAYDKEVSALPFDAEKVGTQTAGVGAVVDFGSMKQRTASGLGTPLTLSIDVIPSHVAQTVHMLAFRKPVIEVGRVLNNRAVIGAIENTAGVEQARALSVWLKYVAGERPAANGWSRAAGWCRRNSSLYTMGFKLTTMIAQTTGILATVSEIGVADTMRGVMHVSRNPLAAYEQAKQLSPMMRNRIHAVDREVYENSTKLMDTGSKYAALDPLVFVKRWMEDHAFLPMGYVQMFFADLPTWHGAYEAELKKNGGNMDAAREYADAVVERTQVGGSDKDLAGVQRGNELGKLMTMFYSYFSALYQLSARRITMLNRNRDMASAMRLGTLALCTWFLEPVISGILLGKSPDADDDGEEWAKWIAKQALFNPFNMVIGVRDVAGMVDSMMSGYGRGFRLSSSLDVFDSTAKFGKQIYKAFEGEGDAKKFFLSGLKATGQATGLVNAQELLLLERFWDWLDGSDPDIELADLIRKKRK